MSNSNPNDTELEQQRAESATAALKSQTEDNHTENSEAAADRIASNVKDAKEDKQYLCVSFSLEWYSCIWLQLSSNNYLSIGNCKIDILKNNNVGANMSNPTDNMDAQEKKIQQLSEDIDPGEDATPDSLAEATTASPLDDDELGGNATQDDINK